MKTDITDLIFSEKEKEMPEINQMSQKQANEIIELAKSGEQIKIENKPETKIETTSIDQTMITEGTMYRYTDANGIVVMGNSLESVPIRYRANMRVLKATTDNLKTPVIINNNRIFVPVKITYKGRTENIRLLVDTGATGINISQRIATLLNINPTDGYQGSSILADGRRIPTLFTKADSVTVGPKTLTNTEIQVMMRERNEDDGLLGMAFLGKFPHTIDVKAQIIKWH